MIGRLGLGGVDDMLGTLVLVMVVASIGLTILGAVYAVRTWRAQSAALQTRRDVAEIKQMLQDQSPPASLSVSPPEVIIEDGPKIADK